jgi:cell division protein FtsL
MRNSPALNPLVWLLAGCMVSAVAVVELRHESRVLYAQVQKLQHERDALNVEWGQLLLEEGAWSQHRRIEAVARAQLGMELPDAQQLRIVALPAGGKP